MLKHLLVVPLVWLLAPLAAVAQAPSPLGLWEDESGEARVEVGAVEGELTGRLVWMRSPVDPQTGLPKTDHRNPDPELRARPLRNLLVLRNMRYNGDENRWEGGEIYDPHSGRSYSCYLWLEKPDQLVVKGYLGISLLGRSHSWHRVKPTTAQATITEQ